MFFEVQIVSWETLLYYVRKSMINIKNNDQENDINVTRKGKCINSTDIQDLLKKSDLMFLKNNYSQIYSCQVGQHYFYSCYI